MENAKAPIHDDSLDLSIGEELETNLIKQPSKPIIEQIYWPSL